jgi:hypothetical protein
VSHSAERKEKDCLNCGTIVHGRYCHICGQENRDPKESFWHILTHFFSDITHFDGKFFTTVKDLAFKPGFLSKEYIKGRRASYLDPIRMYVFTSAIFFLVFFAFIYSDKRSLLDQSTINGKTISAINAMDSASFAEFTASINREDKKPAVPMTRAQFQTYLDTAFFGKGIHFTSSRYRSKAHYDSVLASGQKKHSWVQRQLVYKEIALNERYHNDFNQILNAFRDAFVHSLPQMLFVSLPLLALILRLLYIRRKQFYYVSHGIFSLHLYTFLFIAMLLLFGLSRLNGYLHWSLLSTVIGFGIFGLFVYEYLAMKNFYSQGWGKTFLKFILVNLLFVIVLCLVFVAFILLSFFKI